MSSPQTSGSRSKGQGMSPLAACWIWAKATVAQRGRANSKDAKKVPSVSPVREPFRLDRVMGRCGRPCALPTVASDVRLVFRIDRVLYPPGRDDVVDGTRV